MAGLDYSGVREPGFDSLNIAQRPQINEYIAKLCDALPELYFNPPSAPSGDGEAQKRDGQEWWVRQKNIYYDTDDITEAQTEELLLCPDCRGILKVVSRTTKNPACLGIEIPLGACPRCRNLGHTLYEEAQVKEGYRYAQLIDRPGDGCLRHGF